MSNTLKALRAFIILNLKSKRIRSVRDSNNQKENMILLNKWEVFMPKGWKGRIKEYTHDDFTTTCTYHINKNYIIWKIKTTT